MAVLNTVTFGAAANDNSNGGTPAWGLEGVSGILNIIDMAEEFHEATVGTFPTNPSQYLKVTGPDAGQMSAIGDSDTVSQIVFTLQPRTEDTGDVVDTEAFLVIEGVIQSADNQASGTQWNSMVAREYTFTGSWTGAQVKAATSGFVISVEDSSSNSTAQAGGIWADYTYTAGAAPSTPKQASSLNLGLKGLGF